jgi:hypothetical protein
VAMEAPGVLKKSWETAQPPCGAARHGACISGHARIQALLNGHPSRGQTKSNGRHERDAGVKPTISQSCRSEIISPIGWTTLSAGNGRTANGDSKTPVDAEATPRNRLFVKSCRNSPACCRAPWSLQLPESRRGAGCNRQGDSSACSLIRVER